MRAHKYLPLMAMLALCLAACEPEAVTPKPEETGEHILAKTPRFIAAHDGKIYVSCYQPASVIRIDTSTLHIEAQCRLGRFNPEGIAIANNKLFAVSSWGADENGNYLYDDKVYVVDLTTFAITDSIHVGLNPQRILAIDDNHLIVNYSGNYADNEGGSAIIDATTHNVTQTGHVLTAMCADNGTVFGYSSPYGATAVNYVQLNPATLSATPILEGCEITNPYSINRIDGTTYLTTTGNYTANGDVVRCSTGGSDIWRHSAGMLPSKVVAVGDGTALVLNEGNWSGNNASLSRMDLTDGDIHNGIFESANNRGLGDVAQDLLVYGSKAYITVSFSNTIEVVSTTDIASKQIKLE